MKGFSLGSWTGGLAEWTEGATAYLSVAFSWKLDDAYSRASWYRAQGYRVIAGGPGVFTRRAYLERVAEVPTQIVERMTRNGVIKKVETLADYHGALQHHNPMATKASEGCPVDCAFCVVPALFGVEFTLYPEFEPRPVLTDNNLSALSVEYQNHIIDRFKGFGVPLLDANSGFEPKTFDEDVFERWQHINKGRGGSGSTRRTRRTMSGASSGCCASAASGPARYVHM